MHTTHFNNFFSRYPSIILHARTHASSGNFDVLDDNLSPDPIGVSLYNEQKTPIWQSKSGTSEGTFTIHNARSGKYEFCIQNGNLGSDDTYAKQDGFPREVGFAIRVVPPARGLDGEIFGPDDQLTANLLTMSSKLLTGLHTMSDHQEYMRERENKHRILAGLTFHTVMQWTILEAIILILIAFAQVLYLKNFFEQRRYL